MFRLDGVPDAIGADSGLEATLIAGDVLFAGGIGRTDLPGGSDADMTTSPVSYTHLDVYKRQK